MMRYQAALFTEMLPTLVIVGTERILLILEPDAIANYDIFNKRRLTA
jgi:hypothetical protein